MGQLVLTPLNQILNSNQVQFIAIIIQADIFRAGPSLSMGLQAGGIFQNKMTMINCLIKSNGTVYNMIRGPRLVNMKGQEPHLCTREVLQPPGLYR